MPERVDLDRIKEYRSHGYIEVAIPSIDARLKAVEEEAFRLKDELAEITEERNLWRSEHESDCPNLDSMQVAREDLAEAQNQLSALQSENEALHSRIEDLADGVCHSCLGLVCDSCKSRGQSISEYESRIAELESQLVTVKQAFEDLRIAGQASITEALAAAIEQTQRVNELESQVAAYHAAAARVAGDALRMENIMHTSDDIWARQVMEAESKALRARQDALEEACKAVCKFCRGEWSALPATFTGRHWVHTKKPDEKAGLVCSAEAIRALSGPEGGTSK